MRITDAAMAMLVMVQSADVGPRSQSMKSSLPNLESGFSVVLTVPMAKFRNRTGDGLRRRGIDVTTTVEAGLRSATDEEHARFARTQQRVIVSSDRDFLVLA